MLLNYPCFQYKLKVSSRRTDYFFSNGDDDNARPEYAGPKRHNAGQKMQDRKMQGWKWDQSCSTGKCGTVKIDYRVYVLRVKYIKSAIIVLTEQQFKVWSRTSNERTTESCSVLVNV